MAENLATTPHSNGSLVGSFVYIGVAVHEPVFRRLYPRPAATRNAQVSLDTHSAPDGRPRPRPRSDCGFGGLTTLVMLAREGVEMAFREGLLPAHPSHGQVAWRFVQST